MQQYVANIFVQTHPRPLRWSQKVETFILKIVMLFIKLKGMERMAP